MHGRALMSNDIQSLILVGNLWFFRYEWKSGRWVRDGWLNPKNRSAFWMLLAWATTAMREKSLRLGAKTQAGSGPLLLFQERIQDSKNASIAWFLGVRCYQTCSEILAGRPMVLGLFSKRSPFAGRYWTGFIHTSKDRNERVQKDAENDGL